MKVSIVTVTFNCADTVEECLESVVRQSHTPIQHVLIDGVSTDGTLEALKTYRCGCGIVFSEPDYGIYDGLNKGLARATGEIVGILHGDDTFADFGVVEEVVAAFSDPLVQVVYGDLEYVAQKRPDHVRRYWKSGVFSQAKLHRGWMPPHPTLFVRRGLYDRFGIFDTSYQIAADYDFMLRVLKHLFPGQVAYIPRVFTRMRMGGVSNRSLASIAQKSREDYRALRSNGVGGLGTLFLKNARKLPQFWQRSLR